MQEALQGVKRMINTQFLLKVLVAAFATVGVEEVIKNFWKTDKKIWYAVIMIPLAVGCYVCTELLPIWVIGSLLTVGSVQLCYQTLVQGFKAIIENATNKIKNTDLKEGGENV